MSEVHPEAPADRPSPLLVHLAGEAAPALARLWSAPHAAYLAAAAARRHLLGLALAEGVALDPELAAAALGWPLKQAIARLLPEAPAGLRRALERMGEVGWAAADYRLLLAALRRPEAAKVVRHAREVSPERVRTLAATPEPLLRAGLGRLALPAPAAELAVECFELIERREGAARARALAERWRAAADAPALFKLVRDELTPELPPPPFPSTARLRWFRTKAEMREAAGRYRNCLRRQIGPAAEGRYVAGEWVGEPALAVGLELDVVVGWRLDQVRAVENTTVPEAPRGEILAELRALGVHVGRAGWQLIADAEYAGEGRLTPDPPGALERDQFGEPDPAQA